ncbi:MAG: aminoglycoside phosphotransferase family protein [Chitinophagaceae bacterium]|nr:aminoglycoside phosphotransferase family protein [Chitinophagaceae bacterium]
MAVDIENQSSLVSYLHSLSTIGREEDCTVDLLSGGVSNKTVLLTRSNGEQWVIKQALDKLRVKEDWYCDEKRIAIEYKALRWLFDVLPKGAVPAPVFFDDDNHVLCMVAVPPPHDNLKALILNGVVNPGLFKILGNLLGVMQHAGRSDREAISLFRDKQYFKNLRIEPFYQFTASQLPEAKIFYDTLVARSLGVTETVCHGDYSPKNVLVRNGDVVLLDYEVMHYGDPMFDIGFFLCQMLCFINHLENKRAELKDAALEFWNSYINSVGPVSVEAEHRAADHTLGCLLARVKGRSPVDFLTVREQHCQVKISLALTEERITRIPELIEKFVTKLSAC